MIPGTMPAEESRIADRETLLNNLRQQLRGYERRRASSKSFLQVYWAMSVTALALLVMLMLHVKQGWWESSLEVVLGIAASLFCAAAVSERGQLRQHDNDIEQTQFQIDLYSFETSERELKAETLLKLSDYQLQRYYNLNLRQNRYIFLIGISCIVAGLVVIVATIYMVGYGKHLAGSQDHIKTIAIAVLGSVGALLTDYVAAIYLKMHAAASKNLSSFHSRLVATHQLLMGNLLASRISNDQKRWDTLSALAVRLAPNSKSDSAG